MRKLLKYGFYGVLLFYMFISSMVGTIGGDTKYSMIAVMILFFLVFKGVLKSIITALFKRIFA